MIRHATATDVAANVDLGADVGRVAVLNRSATVDVWTRADGTPAAVEADDCRVVPPGTRRTFDVDTDGDTLVSIVTAAGLTADVEVEG
jgi:hypothetical protein